MGSIIELNSGEVAIVIEQNKIRKLKPKIMIILNAEKKPATPVILNLLHEPKFSNTEIYTIKGALAPNSYGIDPYEIIIDDFGTGYSSLARLKTIPFHQLKVDQSFVKNMTKNEIDLKIVESTILLAHAFNATVVAEGIEEQDTLEKLIAMDCDYAQGFYLSKPLPFDQLIELFTAGKTS